MELTKSYSHSAPSIGQCSEDDTPMPGSLFPRERRIFRSQICSEIRDSTPYLDIIEPEVVNSCGQIPEAVYEVKQQQEKTCCEETQRNDSVKSLFLESHFRQKLHVERKIIRQMVKNSSGYQNTQKLKQTENKVLSYYCNSVSVFPQDLEKNVDNGPDVLQQIDGNLGDDATEFEETTDDEEESCILNKDLTLPCGISENPIKQSRKLFYWLTCSYRLTQNEDNLHVVVRQTGTLPKLRGKLWAKVYLEESGKAHRITLAESQSDNSFRSHELFIQMKNKTEIHEKVLVIKLFDQKHMFARTCLGDWRLKLTRCSQVTKVECEKFLSDQ